MFLCHTSQDNECQYNSALIYRKLAPNLANHDLMITIMIKMLPESVSDYLVTKYEPEKATRDEMEKHLMEHLLKLEEKGGFLFATTFAEYCGS